MDDVREATLVDPELKLLASTMRSGFPETHHSTDPAIRQYFNVRNDLWFQNDIIMFQNRIVIPKQFRNQILQSLHSAHQGIAGMRARASNCVYWPGLSSTIKQTRSNCRYCNEIAPSQARQDLQLIPASEYPFQHLCIDAFEMHGHQYLAAVDRFSGWLVVFTFTHHPQSRDILKSLRSLFSVYGAPEKLFSDGGLQFQSHEFKQFLEVWKITHVTSSAHYPQANGRAELAVKTAKRILSENVAPNGSLNTDKACRALLQYRNTPIQHLGLSPSQILFHRDLRDGVPTDPRSLRPHKRWIKAAYCREEAFKNRNQSMIERYNHTTRDMSPLPVGSTVLIQDQQLGSKRRWNKFGSVVGYENRQYTIRMEGSGRVVTRNRRFIKPIDTGVCSDISTGLFDSPTDNNEARSSNQFQPANSNPFEQVDIDHSSPLQGETRTEPSQDTPETSSGSARIPRAVKQLWPHNKPGLREF